MHSLYSMEQRTGRPSRLDTEKFRRADLRRLEKALKKTASVTEYKRIQGVLMLATGHSRQKVADLSGVDRTSVWRWHSRYLKRRRVEDLYDPPRPGREQIAGELSPSLIDEILGSSPQDHGIQATT